jgi:DUF1009 family protein
LSSPGIAGPGRAVFAHVEGRVVGRARPSMRDRTDIASGVAAVARLGRFDTGSAVVVARAHILAFAAAESATAMLERVGSLRQWGTPGKRRVGALVCRADDAADAQTLQDVIEAAARQGLAGIAVAGPEGALAPYEEASLLADAQGLFLVTCRVGEEG